MGDLDVGDHRPALLRQTGLVETNDMLAFETRGLGQRCHHGDRTGTANTHDVDAKAQGIIDLLDWRGQLALERRDAALFLLGRAIGGRRRIRSNGEERRAEALHAAVVLVARRLMDARLASELGVHRLDAHAVRLLAAIAAAFAHTLVDDDDLSRLIGLATAARAAQLSGAFLIVQQHGGTRDRGQHTLCLIQTVAVPDFGATRQLHGIEARRVVGGDDDLVDAIGEQLGDHIDHRHFALDGLTTRHRGVGVAQQLEGDVDSGRCSIADRQAARVRIGTVAHVLEDVLGFGKGRHADPLRALGTHVRAHHHIAPHPHGHRVAANTR